MPTDGLQIRAARYRGSQRVIGVIGIAVVEWIVALKAVVFKQSNEASDAVRTANEPGQDLNSDNPGIASSPDGGTKLPEDGPSNAPAETDAHRRIEDTTLNEVRAEKLTNIEDRDTPVAAFGSSTSPEIIAAKMIVPATFTIAGGADAALFDVVAGNLVFRAAPNFETDPHSYQVVVSASDGANTATRTITVNLTDLNDSAPVITTAAIQSVAENSTVVAALTSTDADTVGTNPATFTIAGGADAALFDVVAGNLVFRAAPNFETDPHSYQVVVSASDGANTATRTITVNLTDLNDSAPVITTAAIQSVAENSTVVAALTSTDADTVGTNPATFTITGGADAALFDIVAGNLVFRAAPDFETDPHSYQVVVSASDGANTATQTITVNLTDLNDNAPVITTAATSRWPRTLPSWQRSPQPMPTPSAPTRPPSPSPAAPTPRCSMSSPATWCSGRRQTSRPTHTATRSWFLHPTAPTPPPGPSPSI